VTLEISLAPDEEARLRARAAAAQKDVSAYAREAVLEKLDRPTPHFWDRSTTPPGDPR
jgi:hypothetical protein